MCGSPRLTLAGTARRSGTGLHTGAPAAITLGPAPFGAGIAFVTDRGVVPATLACARAEPGCTVLTRGTAAVRTPEHLLAALAALGVTDATVALDGPEVPGLDGSAAGWVAAIDEAGRTEGPPLAEDPLAHEVRVEAFGGIAEAGPGASLTVEVDFGEAGPRGALTVPRTEAAFRTEIAWARTFVLAADVERLLAAGLGRGASADNTLVWEGGPPPGARSPDEPVRHKALDAWGDLALLGPIAAAVRVVRGSHRLHLALLDAIRTRRAGR